MHNINLVVQQEDSLKRLDSYLPEQFPKYSRTYFKKLIDDKAIKINQLITPKASYCVRVGDVIEFTFPAAQLVGLPLPEEDMGVKIVYEHSDFLIVYKPAGLIVHKPTSKSTIVSLVDWLVHKFKDLKDVGYEDRPGIVHRLDRDTSGLLIIPKKNHVHAIFADMFKNRTISKTYFAIIEGHPPAEGTIDYHITRHPALKHKMTHTFGYGRNATTLYKVDKYLTNSSLVEIKLITGRTHQIRVHFSASGHPLIGDSLYGSSSKFISRQALHAYRISFTYEDKYYSFCYDIPTDMKKLLSILESN